MQKNMAICACVCAVIGICIGGCIFCGNKTEKIVMVNGECLTTAPKDKTAITLRVSVLDKNAIESVKRATKRVADINEYLSTLDVNVQTNGFDSYEKSEWNHEKQKSTILGTETNISLEVSSNKIENIEKILSEFAGQPNIYTENLRMFTSRETLKPIMDNCLKTAVADARSRADALVSGAGRSVGKLVSVSYGNNTPSGANAMIRMAKSYAAMDEMASGVLSSKDTELSVTVSATFEIK